MRRELAEHEWARLKANDSLECRNCHSRESMDFTRQSARAAAIHQRYLFTGRAHLHRLPQGHRARVAGYGRRAARLGRGQIRALNGAERIGQ